MKYTIQQHIRYLSNYNRVSVYVQANLEHLPPLKDISPLYVREMKMNDENDLQKWVDIINDAYSEFDEETIDVEKSVNYLKDHQFMNVDAVYFIIDGNEPVGSITCGTYKSNDKIACCSRIAIKSNYKGRGLGKYIICYGYTKLRDRGINYGQSIIMVKRIKSILIHFDCGFIPQFKKKYKVFNNQKRFIFVKVFTLMKVKKLYKSYLKTLGIS